jgi:hypothetical protein
VTKNLNVVVDYISIFPSNCGIRILEIHHFVLPSSSSF